MDEINIFAGLTLGILAGALLGSFAFPMKKIKSWQWENTWIMYSFWALLILPAVLAFLSVPNFFSIYGNVPINVLLLVFLFGATWGIANIGFGLSIKMLGLALATAIVLGLNNAIGAILPIILYTPEELVTPSGLGIIAGVVAMIIGIAICALAGNKKDKALKTRDEQVKIPGSTFLKGLIVALIAGVTGAMLNFALIAGKPLEYEAIQMGATTLNAANPTWVIALLGGFIITLAYCIYLFKKQRSFSLFRTGQSTNINWVYTFIMAVMWFGGLAIYGMSVSKLGKLGASIGWPVIQSMAVISGNVIGILTGEWKDTGRSPLIIMIIGLFFLFIGIGIVGWASSL